MIPPRRLAVSRLSPHYNAEALRWVDRVYVNDEWIPDCVAYNMDEGWAFGKVNGTWAPRRYGVVRVTMRDTPRETPTSRR